MCHVISGPENSLQAAPHEQFVALISLIHFLHLCDVSWRLLCAYVYVDSGQVPAEG